MAKAPSAKVTKKMTFHQQLVLNRWLMSFFKGEALQALKLRLGDESSQGIDEDGQSLFFYQLTHNLFEIDLISEADLRRYDLNIVSHWQAITEKRNKLEGHLFNMTYFQYLSLLFTEIYLDYYFNKPQALLDGLNQTLTAYNEQAPDSEKFEKYLADDLNKLAYWNATGSGKTLLLHINIKQYLHYFQQGNVHYYPDNIILLTPNEGLSRQHLQEFELSNFKNVELFNKDKNDLWRGDKGTIELIDINKLSDTSGDKTVAVESFEGDNLILIDEGHRGLVSGADGAWMQRRTALISKGFAFEYSATFGQSLVKGLTIKATEEDIKKKEAKKLFGTAALKTLSTQQLKQLELNAEQKSKARTTATKEVYAKSILFDYSYKYFYEDGYGKESLILNIRKESYQTAREKYFTACLLAFYQQLWLWSTHRIALAEYNIEKPLWIFVGNTVNSEDSDILEVVNFLAYFLTEEAQIKVWLKDLIEDKAQLLDTKGNNIFQNRFTPLMAFNQDMDALYTDILERLFNSSVRQRLKLVNIKNTKGELALKVGEAEPFGLVNIGDDAKFIKNIEELENNPFDIESDDFGGTLFDTINNKESELNVLVGSKKFTEGWSSWRVSTMGLLNMGKGEGSQIIQLFGRGVRLKGKNFSLKRTPANQRPKGLHLDKLETLNIFGVNADYMETFKKYLRDEGITPSDEILELNFPTQINLPSKKLKTLALMDGYKDNQKKGFKRSEFPWLYEIPEKYQDKIKKPHVTLDLYPKVEALSSSDNNIGTVSIEARQQAKLDQVLFTFFDFDAIYLTIQQHKLQKSWSNLKLDKQKLIDFCYGTQDWYTLYIPASELIINQFSDIQKQQVILVQLLLDYTYHFYRALKGAYEGQFYEIVMVDENNGSLITEYKFEIEDSDDGNEYLKRLEILKKLVEEKKIGAIKEDSITNMVAICFEQHLYYPLFGFDDSDKKAIVPLKLTPLALAANSEVRFVQDLKTFSQSSQGKALIGNKSLYLLRNADNKAKGLGFALAGNFYPDFLLWLVDDSTGEQWLSFIDPKGLRNISLDSPKLNLYKEIKELETKLTEQLKPEEKPLILNAFILSDTNYMDLVAMGKKEPKEDLEAKHILFMEDNNYLFKLFQSIH